MHGTFGQYGLGKLNSTDASRLNFAPKFQVLNQNRFTQVRSSCKGTAVQKTHAAFTFSNNSDA